jgi:hypothetical protein
MNRRSFALLAVGLAHHSISGVYDSRRRMALEGLVTEFQFVNPHPFVIIESTNHDGQSEQWKLDMDNHNELADVGFTKDTLKAGDRIKVIGNIARREARRLYVRRLERVADGFIYEHT